MQEGNGLEGCLSTLFGMLYACEECRISYNNSLKCPKCKHEEILQDVNLSCIVNASMNYNPEEFNSFQDFLKFRFTSNLKECPKCMTMCNCPINMMRWPQYLFICLENSEFEIELKDLNYLKKDDINYEFISSVLHKNAHFTTLLKNPTIKARNNFEELQGFYYHDGMKNMGKLVKLSGDIENCTALEEPYFLIYKRVD